MKCTARQIVATVIGTAHRRLNTSPTARIVSGLGNSAPASASPADPAVACWPFLPTTACPL
jgi:hypothetical protein